MNSTGDCIFQAGLTCPHVRFTPHFPDPHGSLSDYDFVQGIRFCERHPYLREGVDNLKEMHFPVADIQHTLAEMILYQLQETIPVRIDFEHWLEAVTNLHRQTGFKTWGKQP